MLSSEKVSERLIGVISVDGKSFVMADEDGTFTGNVVDADTLDYCYTDVSTKSRASPAASYLGRSERAKMGARRVGEGHAATGFNVGGV